MDHRSIGPKAHHQIFCEGGLNFDNPPSQKNKIVYSKNDKTAAIVFERRKKHWAPIFFCYAETKPSRLSISRLSCGRRLLSMRKLVRPAISLKRWWRSRADPR
jgi:hypothetical protein